MSRAKNSITFHPRTALPPEEAAHLSRAVGRTIVGTEYDRGRVVLHFEGGEALEIAVDPQTALLVAAICSRGARRGGAALCFGWQSGSANGEESA